jgi:hypothetical protein
MGDHDLESAGRNTRGGEDDPAGAVDDEGDAPRHLTQVRSLPVSATSTKGCAGVPTRSRTKYCPVPVYAPDVSGIANADDSGDVEVEVSVSAARRPWAWWGEVDASLVEM